ncbi:MAG: phage shock protein [Chloroflexota bacterium]|jgi:phage shock protein PspC (stress-responsive transcriptional regulator)|nr:phage shock protein [Chloroflexota bacterium]
MREMQQPTGTQTFFRGSDRILGGVCSGLAEGFHVETLWVRLAFVVLTFLNGIGLLLYVILWVLMPERTGYRPSGQGAVESMRNDVKRAWADLRAQFGGSSVPPTTSTADVTPPSPAPGGAPTTTDVPPPPSHGTSSAARNPSFIFGAILIVIGIAFLAANTNIVNWSVIWPVALLVLGIGLLVRNMEKKSGK